jgi:hypothetical protein
MKKESSLKAKSVQLQSSNLSIVGECDIKVRDPRLKY